MSPIQSVTRRSLLAGAAGSAVVAGLAACSNPSPPTSGPTVEIVVALVPDPPGASAFYRQQFDAFEAANPGVKVKIIENPGDKQLSAVELMFQQGKAPDVYRAQESGFDRMHERGWTRSLQPYVTDAFTGRFPQGSLNPATSGIHRNGELYAIPLTWGNWATLDVFVHNRKLLQASGYSQGPRTWSEIEEIAKGVTRDGKGKVFGFAPTQASGIVRLARQGVPYSIPGDGLDFRTGKPATANPTMVEAVELHRRMQADGSMITGWETWDSARSYTEFAAGRFAMYVTAPWHVAEIRKLVPDIDLGISVCPVPDGGRGGFSPITATFAPMWAMSSESKNPDQAWKVLDFLASPEFHLAYYREFGTLTALESAWEGEARKQPDQAALLDVAKDSMALVPNPRLASAGGKVILDARAKKPELRFTDAAMESMVKNQAFAPKAAALDDALATFLAGIYQAGKATAADITFADWDPARPYEPRT